MQRNAMQRNATQRWVYHFTTALVSANKRMLRSSNIEKMPIEARTSLDALMAPFYSPLSSKNVYAAFLRESRRAWQAMGVCQHAFIFHRTRCFALLCFKTNSLVLTVLVNWPRPHKQHCLRRVCECRGHCHLTIVAKLFFPRPERTCSGRSDHKLLPLTYYYLPLTPNGSSGFYPFLLNLSIW